MTLGCGVPWGQLLKSPPKALICVFQGLPGGGQTETLVVVVQRVKRGCFLGALVKGPPPLGKEVHLGSVLSWGGVWKVLQ